MKTLDDLIKIFQEMQLGRDPVIPYSLANFVRVLHENIGTTDTITALERFKESK